MDPGFYRFFRSITPSGVLKWIDRYNYEAQELQDLIQTAPAPIQVQTLDCTTAQSVSLIMNYPARAFVIYFYDSTSAVEAIKPNGFVKVRINDDRVENEFPAKHNRGYRGDFYRLFLQWPAQTNTKAHLVMHMFDDDPWEMDAVGSAAAGGLTITAFNNERIGLGDGVTTVFNLTNSPVSAASVLVTQNGSKNTLTTDYTVQVGAKTVTFVAAPAGATKIDAYYPS